MERGYREHERERPRQRSSDRRDGGRRGKDEDDDVERKFGRGREVEDKFGRKDDGAEKFGDGVGNKPPEKLKKEKKPAPAAPPTGEPMIIVNVNDRLGTKASIPCMASDPISMSHPSIPQVNPEDVRGRVETDVRDMDRAVQGTGRSKHWQTTA